MERPSSWMISLVKKDNRWPNVMMGDLKKSNVLLRRSAKIRFLSSVLGAEVVAEGAFLLPLSNELLFIT